MNHHALLRLAALPLALAATLASAAPKAGDRVYTADQNTNTVSVIDPVDNTLLGGVQTWTIEEIEVFTVKDYTY